MSVQKYYIGWDVGAWNCDKNKSSRDGIVILNEDGGIIGKKRCSLRDLINRSETYQQFLTNLFYECNLKYQDQHVVLAIDAPLGYSDAFIKLISAYDAFDKDIKDFKDNPYMFRATERFLYDQGYTPLSAVNHMIGSQSTKAIHFISKFECYVESVGIWKTNNKRLTVIETYPAVNIVEVLAELDDQHKDINDAFKCAYIAKVFDQDRSKLYSPINDVSEKEGWIWVLAKKVEGIGKIILINEIVENFFNDNSSIQIIPAKDLMPYFIDAGVFNKDFKKGKPIRDFLRKLDKEDKLEIINNLYADRKEINTYWYFRR